MKNMMKIDNLRKLIKANNIDFYIIPLSDEYLNEYPPAHLRRLQWLTGFSGSSGLVIVSQTQTVFFTDGRYTIQAKDELDENIFKIFNISDKQPWQYLNELNNNSLIVGYNPALFSDSNVNKYISNNIKLKPIYKDLVDRLWTDKKIELSKVDIHEIEYSGQSHIEKINIIASNLAKQNVDYAIITALDSICWLLNIRGRDIPCTPFVICQAIISKDGKVNLFIDEERISQDVKNHLTDIVEIQPSKQIDDLMNSFANKNILLDKSNCPYLFFDKLSAVNANVIKATDPCILPKACKNDIELKNMRDAHIIDGIALTKFLKWLDNYENKSELSELLVSQKLQAFRKENSEFIEPSFDTIAGFGSNGAIIHYRVNEKTNKNFQEDNLFLVDSGGQYKKGTTDVTRTIAIGKPSAEHIRNFTLVLKGHIALANAIFPKGTTGSQLDILARQYLWQNGLDYDHGTGHGVGSFLSVHEGPQRISKMANNVVLQKGMIISNEPGYYKQGEYGIRIENLVEVVNADIKNATKEFLKFNTLTKAPIDSKLIDFSMLNTTEKQWLNDYHENVFSGLEKHLN